VSELKCIANLCFEELEKKMVIFFETHMRVGREFWMLGYWVTWDLFEVFYASR
jgi:hypothetical protein